MILIVTNERDLTSDYIVLELRRRNLSFYRLNTERLPEGKIAFNPQNGERAWQIELNGHTINFLDVTAGYYRRPGKPIPDEAITNEAARQYCATEWDAALTAALHSLGNRWLNAPFTVLTAENKALQLALAHRLGFCIPETSITNDIGRAQIVRTAGTAVVKPLRESLLSDPEGDHVIFTNRLNNLAIVDEDAVRAAPIIFQREISKQSDIRVTVIGDAAYAAEILSQAHDETKTDWRRGSRPDLEHLPHDLPDAISKKCVSIVQELGLRFGAIDLILDREAQYWFLEVNPNGQWAWIESRTGLPLSRAIVDELERIAAC
jgi:glutathione synthase/RimK-type ligase-like ATP-grasp enzyme